LFEEITKALKYGNTEMELKLRELAGSIIDGATIEIKRVVN